MITATKVLSKHPISAQVVGVALLMSLATYLSVTLSVIPGPINALWIIVLPILLGLALNRGMLRFVMAAVLLGVSWIAVSAVGNAMGGV